MKDHTASQAEATQILTSTSRAKAWKQLQWPASNQPTEQAITKTQMMLIQAATLRLLHLLQAADLVLAQDNRSTPTEGRGDSPTLQRPLSLQLLIPVREPRHKPEHNRGMAKLTLKMRG